MTTAADFAEARKAFHASLLQSTLTICTKVDTNTQWWREAIDAARSKT